MSQQTAAILGVIALLGSGLVVGGLALGAIVSLVRGSRPLARWIGLAAIGVVSYLAILLGFAGMSREKVLLMGEEKYFCEIDCHLAYSVVGVDREPLAGGTRYVVQVQVRFDPGTISPHRGDSPLTPNPKRARLVDSQGRFYDPSVAAPRALAELATPLRPGESFVTPIAFDVPTDGHSVWLLIEEADPITAVIIGHENSLGHHKTRFGLEGLQLKRAGV